MASSSYPCSSTHKYLIITLLLVFSFYLQNNANNCNAIQTLDFEMHHRFSDQVIAVMGADNLPERGSCEYHAAMVRRDKVFHGRALAENDDDSKLLTLSDGIKGNFDIASQLGSLHYANVSLGTPSLSFFVALDTGTSLLWVPCDQTVMTSTSGLEMHPNTYSMNSSSTSKAVSCNSSLCELQNECSQSSSQCPYRVAYNANISSSGVLVEDVLRLKTDSDKPKDIGARITFGCGQVQTGFYLNGSASNGLFGLGIGYTSVPSILSRKGLVADSFSMCFGSEGVGRISFGDIGSSDQEETPLNPMQQSPWYNISVTQLSVGGIPSELLDVTAVFYSGAVYTYLDDPAYTALCGNFDSQIDKRHSSDPTVNFEYCYDVSTIIPNVTLIMEGGSQFNVYNPMIPITTDGTVTSYCLGVIKTSGGNFIGNNFLTGQNIVFNREKMLLGWKPSNCTDGIVRRSNRPKAPPRRNSMAPAPAQSPGNGANSMSPQFSMVPSQSPMNSPNSTESPSKAPAQSPGNGANSMPPQFSMVPAQSPMDSPNSMESPSKAPAQSPTNGPNSTESTRTGSNSTESPRNGPNSKAPQFSVGKPRDIYFIASLLFMLYLPILQIV